jgi:hypothetical protein
MPSRARAGATEAAVQAVHAASAASAGLAAAGGDSEMKSRAQVPASTTRAARTGDPSHARLGIAAGGPGPVTAAARGERHVSVPGDNLIMPPASIAAAACRN